MMPTEDQRRMAQNLGMDIEKFDAMSREEATSALFSASTTKRITAARKMPPGSLVSYKGKERMVEGINREGFLLLQGLRGSVNPLKVQLIKQGCAKELSS